MNQNYTRKPRPGEVLFREGSLDNLAVMGEASRGQEGSLSRIVDERGWKPIHGGQRGDYMSGSMTLAEAAAKARSPEDIPSGRPGSLAARRLNRLIQESGGYHKLTGDARFVADIMDRDMLESLHTRRAGRIVDEALGAGSFDSLLDDNQHKRLIRRFRQRVGMWAQLVPNPRNATDFKDQHAIQQGSIGPLPVVGPSSPYLNVQWSDDEATYAVQKYGGIYATTLEALANDDLQALGRTAEKLGVAFQQTLDKFVFKTKIDDNPTIYDAKTLFHADHNNDLGSSKPLNHDNLEEAKKKLQTQTDLDGNPLDIEAACLIVHPDEQYIAERLVGARAVERPGTANRDINVHAGTLKIIVSSRVTSGVWYVTADPELYDWLELGFLGGQREPSLFQEAENAGRWFDFDERRWKGQLIFGGAITEFRGIVRANA